MIGAALDVPFTWTAITVVEASRVPTKLTLKLAHKDYRLFDTNDGDGDEKRLEYWSSR